MCQALVEPGYMSEWLHWPNWSKKPSDSRITSRKNPRSSACVTSCLRTTPSITAPKSSLPVHPVGADKVLDLVVRLHRFACVSPEALDYVVFDQAIVEIPVVRICDLELAAAGGLQLGQHTPHGLVVEVDAGDRELARRVVGLFDYVLNSACAIQVSDPEVPKVLLVCLVREDDASPTRLLDEGLNAGAKVPLEYVVTEHDHYSVAIDKFLGET